MGVYRGVLGVWGFRYFWGILVGFQSVVGGSGGSKASDLSGVEVRNVQDYV